jgi:hypothetical protein
MEEPEEPVEEQEPKKEKGPMSRKEESSEPTSHNKGPSPVIIIIAAIVVLILIIAGIYFLAFSGSELESVAVGNISMNSDQIEFPIYATPSGVGDYTGKVTVEVYFENDTVPLYTSSVKINDGTGYEEIPYEEFVWDNGEYFIMAKGDGKESSSSIIINNVITSIEVQWSGIDPHSDAASPEYYVESDISFFFGNRDRPSSTFPQGYSFSGAITDPDGGQEAITATLSSIQTAIQKRIEHTTKGTYEISGTLTNTFCKSTSPYATLDIQMNTTFAHDSNPFAIAGDDTTVALSAGEAVVNFDGSGSWDDGSITEYQWDFGDNSTVTSAGPTTSHTYTTPGDYYVTLAVVDDGDNTSMNGRVSTLRVTVTES